MQQVDNRNSMQAAQDFLSRCFVSGESVALFLRGGTPARTTQRIVPLYRALTPRYLVWLAHENSTGANVYVGANPVRTGSKKRTKESIATVRHLYLDLDFNGDAKLAALQSSEAVPAPTIVLSTSPGKYQVLWRVHGFDFEQQESRLKSLASGFGGDPACTDCNRVLRVPGFLNCKYDPAHLIAAEYLSDCTYKPEDFPSNMPACEPTICSRGNRPGKRLGTPTHSEHDWAWISHELAQGKDARKLTRALASRRPDKPNPLYYAQRTVDVASARLWLLEGVRIEDVVTMLEVRRRFDGPGSFCSTRAREIALTAQRMIARSKTN